MLERLVERSVLHQLIVRKEKSAGEFIPTTVGLFPSELTLIQSKAMFGLAAANLSWMLVHSVANPVFGIIAPEKERRVLRSIRTTVIQNTT